MLKRDILFLFSLATDGMISILDDGFFQMCNEIILDVKQSF